MSRALETQKVLTSEAQTMASKRLEEMSRDIQKKVHTYLFFLESAQTIRTERRGGSVEAAAETVQ